jgi:hypothetical protein
MPNAAGNWSDMLSKFQVGNPALSEADLVALLGLHGSGTAEINNSGFQGPWGVSADMNIVNNHFFVNLLNVGHPGAEMAQVQASHSHFKHNPNPKVEHSSPPPSKNLIEWVHTSGKSDAKMMLPIDMQIYLSFNTNSTGG